MYSVKISRALGIKSSLLECLWKNKYGVPLTYKDNSFPTVHSRRLEKRDYKASCGFATQSEVLPRCFKDSPESKLMLGSSSGHMAGALPPATGVWHNSHFQQSRLPTRAPPFLHLPLSTQTHDKGEQ